MLDVRRVALVLLGIGLLAVVAVIAMRLLLAGFGGPAAGPAATLPDQAANFPGPALRTDPTAEPEAYRREKEKLLTGWGWVDRDNGLARIPVERATILLEQRGWPDQAGRRP